LAALCALADRIEENMAELFKMAVVAFEAVGVAVLIFGFMLSTGHFIKRIFRVTERHEAFRQLRKGFSHTLLLALDLLVAADIILTITSDLNFETLGTLGVLVLIRTFLVFVLELEVSGRWLWQSTPRAAGE
jgi:uncharacterized membrane protein